MILVDGKRTRRISALDRGLAYGDGIFRTIRAENGMALHWPRHYRKLRADCARIGIDCPEEPVLAADIDEILRRERDCIVKLIVTRGEGGRGYAPPQSGGVSRVAASFPLPALDPARDRLGVAVRWCTTRVGWQPALAGIKHLNRLENVLARREWSGPEFAEGLMLDLEGRVVEGTMSNVFILEQDVLITPLLDWAGVAGLQRDRLLEQAAACSLACQVERITPERLMCASQVYLTNSVLGLWWVSSLEDRRWRASETTVELTRRLRKIDD
jgi:4-amino-4-deoxychorismate lyase